MTIEELVVKIKGGERELLPALWERVQAFARMQAARWLRAWKEFRPGLEFEDLYSCGWVALCAAVETYDAGRGGSFLGWFKFHLLTEFSSEIGVRTPKQARDPLLSCPASLDKPIGGDTEGLTVGDMIADDANPFDEAEEAVYQEQLQKVMAEALEKLPEADRRMLEAVYYRGESRRSYADRLRIKHQVCYERERRALEKMRRMNGAALRELLYGSSAAYSGGYGSFSQLGSSITEWLVIRSERPNNWRLDD